MEMPCPFMVITLKLYQFHISIVVKLEIEMSPAPSHFPRSLDTDLNSNLCWDPSLMLSPNFCLIGAKH